MNAQRTLDRPVPTAASIHAIPVATQPRLPHRQRDFGVGYGSSSGYASDRRYASQFNQRLFRCG